MLKTFLLRFCLIALAALAGMGVAFLCSPHKEKKPSSRPPMVHQPYTLFRNGGSQATALTPQAEAAKNPVANEEEEIAPPQKDATPQPPPKLIKILPQES